MNKSVKKKINFLNDEADAIEKVDEKLFLNTFLQKISSFKQRFLLQTNECPNRSVQPARLEIPNEIAALGASGAALHVSSGDYKSSRAGEGAYFHDDVDKHRALLKIAYDGPGKVIGNDVRVSE